MLSCFTGNSPLAETHRGCREQSPVPTAAWQGGREPGVGVRVVNGRLEALHSLPRVALAGDLASV